MTIKLKCLEPQARNLISKEIYKEDLQISLNDYISDCVLENGRQIDIEPLLAIIQTGINKFKNDDPIKSDVWLSPRIHATLRLYPSEAADLRLWEYLTIGVKQIRKYVIWRWGDKESGSLKNLVHIYGVPRRNAISRLWWAAELTRNGPNYQPTIDLFSSQDAVNYVTDVLAFDNRATAIAYSRIIRKILDKGGKLKETAVRLGKGLNHILVTVVLGGVVPDSQPELDFYDEWVNVEPDHTLMIDDNPIGPNESQVPEEKILTMEKLIDSI